MWYSYAIVRVVPHVERGELVNVGVVLFARTVPLLIARMDLDSDRVRALAPDVDLDLVARHLRVFEAVCAGEPEGGPVAALPAPERFHWLTAPRSTIIQTSPVHLGRCDDAEVALNDLLERYVRRPAPTPREASVAE